MNRFSFRGANEQNVFVRRARRRRMKSWAGFGLLWLGAAAFGTVYGAGWLHVPATSHFGAAAAAAGIRTHFSMCFIGGGTNCVVDGDTIWLAGEKIRIADIDAPETHDPRCASEKELGDRATERLQELLDNGTVTLAPIDRDIDVYGRKLRLVLVDGKSVGEPTLLHDGSVLHIGKVLLKGS